MFQVPSVGPGFYLVFGFVFLCLAPLFIYNFIQVRKEKRQRRKGRQ